VRVDGSLTDEVARGAGLVVTRPETPSRFERFALLVVLTLFGLTWPVLDLLGRNAEFFLARRSAKGEIVALAMIAIIAAPVMVGLLGSLPGRAGSWLGNSLIGLTATSLALLYVRRLPVAWWVATLAAVVAGAVVLWAFNRFALSRALGRYLLPAPLLVLAVFLLTMPVGEVLAEPSSAVGNPVPIAAPTPILLVVFDEFPVASIIDGEGELRADRYPNFARLAADGTWYRNAMTVEQQTEHSLPAILTGRIPDQASIPVAGHYPFNLFTAMRSAYELHVYEAITQLCPRALCEGLAGSFGSLAGDVGVVSGHVLLPEPMSEDLPPIDRGWGDFAAVVEDFDARDEFRDALAEGPRAPIDAVLDDISSDGGDDVPLYYLHTLVPHHPWQYLPDGRTYPFVVATNPASLAGGWIDDEFLVAQSMQRHLLQVGYADRVVGELIAALEGAEIYDESLVIVVADHGIAIRPGVEHQRVITDDSVGEIAAVPLFVKPPGSSGGAVDDRRALTIDVLPTIADAIGARLPGDIDGVSLLGPPPERSQTTTFGPESEATYGVDGTEKLEVARRIERWFAGGDPWALRPEGSADLVGSSVDPAVVETSDIGARLLEPDLYRDVDTSGAVIPARVGGRLRGPVDGDEVIAVGVNGVIAAVTRSYEDDGVVSFLAMVHPSHFVDGENGINLFEVDARGQLHWIRSEPTTG